MQNSIVKRFDATACARSRCFECNLRMENMISFGEATCLWSSQLVWGNTVYFQRSGKSVRDTLIPWTLSYRNLLDAQRAASLWVRRYIKLCHAHENNIEWKGNLADLIIIVWIGNFTDKRLNIPTVQQTGSDGICGLQNGSLFGRLVVSRVIVSKSTCIVKLGL